ncbi:hypothetical protein BHE74_00040364 [Ensete ventricosum]|nr:hypothetical protein BHE74_00040364 [Ensete ventricosum]
MVTTLFFGLSLCSLQAATSRDLCFPTKWSIVAAPIASVVLVRGSKDLGLVLHWHPHRNKNSAASPLRCRYPSISMSSASAASFYQEGIDEEEDILPLTIRLMEEELQVARILYKLLETILNFDLCLCRITSPSLPDYLWWGTKRRHSIPDDPPPPLPPSPASSSSSSIVAALLSLPAMIQLHRLRCFPAIAASLPREPLRATARAFQSPALLLHLCSGSFLGSLL